MIYLCLSLAFILIQLGDLSTEIEEELVKGQREMNGRVDYSSHRAVSVISDLYTGLLQVMHE
jgi:hypothetical protein